MIWGGSGPSSVIPQNRNHNINISLSQRSLWGPLTQWPKSFLFELMIFDEKQVFIHTYSIFQHLLIANITSLLTSLESWSIEQISIACTSHRLIRLALPRPDWSSLMMPPVLKFGIVSTLIFFIYKDSS